MIDHDMQVITCCDCEIRFGLPRSYVEDHRRTGYGITCPNGHEFTVHAKRAAPSAGPSTYAAPSPSTVATKGE